MALDITPKASPHAPSTLMLDPLATLNLSQLLFQTTFTVFRSRATVIATARAHNHPLITQALFKALSIEQWQEWLAVCQLRPLVSADSLPAETVGLG
ncbi:hypothetical protein PCASD_25689 [Puccinia coronata f. sp. avenae]|uniref:Uncharacterized protein n=1 Tax=Puccinia coronata f. sp. avenae TaxID=200324 RepID=A0A2N5TIP8_9BASI|nr:hypothetical protein PCASD_25689 [Puccinia coronata f. sp. avenae]